MNIHNLLSFLTAHGSDGQFAANRAVREQNQIIALAQPLTSEQSVQC